MFEIQIFFIIRELQPSWNCTLITSISKVNILRGVSNYKPISYAMLVIRLELEF